LIIPVIGTKREVMFAEIAFADDNAYVSKSLPDLKRYITQKLAETLLEKI